MLIDAESRTLHRVVVVVETVDAYERMASPLLNRFEKQVSSYAFGSYAHFLECAKDCVYPCVCR